jgi:hypothetical protein
LLDWSTIWCGCSSTTAAYVPPAPPLRLDRAEVLARLRQHGVASIAELRYVLTRPRAN